MMPCVLFGTGGPVRNREAAEAGATKKELAARHIIRKRFWSALLEYAKSRTKLHSGISPGHYNWVGTTAGLPNGLHLNYAVRKHDCQVELYIDRGKHCDEENRAMFEKIAANKAIIEDTFKGPLEWEALEGRRACRIRKTITGGGWMDEEEWQAVHVKLVDAMIALEAAVKPHLTSL